MASTPTNSALLQLTPTDLGIFVVSMLVAVGLHYLRQGNGRDASKSQGLSDALTVGTIIVLALNIAHAAASTIAVSLMGKPAPPPFVPNQGLLVATVMAYAIYAVGTGLWDSCRRDGAAPQKESSGPPAPAPQPGKKG